MPWSSEYIDLTADKNAVGDGNKQDRIEGCRGVRT